MAICMAFHSFFCTPAGEKKLFNAKWTRDWTGNAYIHNGRRNMDAVAREEWRAMVEFFRSIDLQRIFLGIIINFHRISMQVTSTK